MVDAVALSLLLEVRVFALHLLNHYDREVIYEVAWVVEMGYYFFLRFLVSLQCSLRPDVEGFCVSSMYCNLHFLHWMTFFICRLLLLPHRKSGQWLCLRTVIGLNVFTSWATGVAAWTASFAGDKP